MSPLRITTCLLVSALAAVAACSAGGDDGTPLTPDDGGTNQVPIDGAPPDAGPDAPPAGPVCGNGKVEAPEACDDNNLAAGDGCSPTCTIESAFEGDTCPGKTVALATVGQSLKATITGSTKGAFNHYGSACGGGSGRDVVYTFTPSSSGKAIITLTADYPAIMSARSTCESAASESKCADISAITGGTKTMEVPVFQNTPVYLFVDGYGGAAGDFTIDVDISLAVCGNGVAELPETCDDGNTTNGDGCSSTCALEEGGGVLSQCPGQPFVLTGAPGAPRKISLAGNTKTDGAATQSPSGCFYWNGNNVVYALKSDVDGSAKLALTAGYAKANIHARSDCGSNSFQVGCTQREGPGDIAIEFPVVANQWFYAFVDGDTSGGGGPYTLDVTVTPASCGNGVIDGNEECDDGNTDSGDGCTDTCTREPLPATNSCPGHALALTAQPDGSRTAVVSNSTAGNSSKVAGCGILTANAPDAIFTVTPDIDGLLTADLRGAFNTLVQIQDTCTAPSTVLGCSNLASASTNPFILEGLGSVPKRAFTPVVAGVTYTVVVKAFSTASAQLQQGPFRLDLKVTPAECGNGIIEGSETCDDGATSDNDGCSATCQLEPTAARSTCAQAETITLTEVSPGTYASSIESGTTNLLSNGNFFDSEIIFGDEPCWAPGRNAFFSVTAPVAGVLRATAKSDHFDVVLALRKPTCVEQTVSNNASTSPIACANENPKGGEETVATPVTPGEQVWIVVDTKTVEDFGRFMLDVSLAPSACGDGFFVPSSGEQCDDGNTTNGDGCSSTCELETLPGIDVCPGTTMTLAGSGLSPRTGSMTINTAALAANYSGACGGSGPEGVVKIVAPVNGTVRAKVRGMQNATIYARSVCDDPSTEFLKTSGSTCPFVIHDVVEFPVTAGEDYFIFVDGLSGASGVPTLDVTLTP